VARAVTRPPVLRPMLAGEHGVPRDIDRYQLEPKLDGQRVLATVAGGGVMLTARTGAEITGTYPELGELTEAVNGHEVVLDGEVIAPNEHDRAEFGLLQYRMHVRRPAAQLLADVPVIYVVFDLLWRDGTLLIDEPQEERRRQLEGLELRGPRCQVAPILDATPEELMQVCRQLGLEGFMAKRRNAVYLPGQRSPAWSKIKCTTEREFVVGGWSEGDGNRSGGIGSLAIGYVADGGRRDLLAEPGLRYVGQVGSGLSELMQRQLEPVMARFATGESPFVNPPGHLKLHFVLPLLVVQVAFGEVTRQGILRHPVLKGLRADKPAGEVTWDDDLGPPPGGD
jgi:bifunctional non-homologous end joining protein LigD